MHRTAFAPKECYENCVEVTVMKFIGVTITDIKHNPYNKKVIMLGSKCEINAQLGDVVSYNHDEYVYDGFLWQALSDNNTKQETCLDNRLELKPMKAMTCEKCGAPLKSCECEYCGTRYYIPNVETNTIYAKGEPIKQDIYYLQRQLMESAFQASCGSQRLMMYQNIVNGYNTSWPLI